MFKFETFPKPCYLLFNIINDSIKRGCTSEVPPPSIVNVHQDHGSVTRCNQILVIAVFSLTIMLVIAHY